MVKINDPAKAEDAAQQLLEGRMAYVRRAIETRSALDDAQEALREAEKQDAAAYNSAIKTGGWTEDELRKIGLNQPTKIKRVQQRRRSNGRQQAEKHGSQEDRTDQHAKQAQAPSETDENRSATENHSV